MFHGCDPQVPEAPAPDPEAGPDSPPTSNDYFVSLCMPTVPRLGPTGKPVGYLTQVLAEYAQQVHQTNLNLRIVVMNGYDGNGARGGPLPPIRSLLA